MKQITFLITLMISLVANATPPEQYQSQIQQAYTSGNYQKYFELACQYFSEHQTIDGLLQIAEAYSSGEGVEQNSACAAECFNGIIQSLEQLPELDATMKALLGYSYRMYGTNALMSKGYDLDHTYTKEEMRPYYKGAEYGDAYSMYMIGHCYLSGEYKAISEVDAISYLQRAADKNCISALSDLGGYYDDKGDSDKALQYYIKGANTDLFSTLENANDFISVLVNPNNLRNTWTIDCHELCIYNIGHAYFKIEEEAEALKWLEKLTVDVPKYLNLRAQCYLITGDREKCMRDLKRSVQLEPDSKVYDFMGIICADSGDKVNAEKYFDTAIRLGNSAAAEHKKEYLK